MISKEEATIIAHEHIEGAILRESCRPFMTVWEEYPKCWVFSIYHRNQDKDTFHTVIEITNNGTVASWNKYHVGDENDIEG